MTLCIDAKKKYILFFILAMIAWFAFCLPDPIFNDPASTVIEDYKGRLLSARIADDEQWRFPEPDSIPEKFIKALTYFEDEYFYYHPGINPISLLRAFKQNITAGKVVSGGSTISMQTIRLSRKGQPRNLLEKTIEIFQALRMEIIYSKDEIINLYASHAPYGGNVVGLEAAAWRYYGRSPAQLSWGELAALAVLPNAPALIYPGKNHEKLKQKRNRLLDKLYQKGGIDYETCELAKSEPLPGNPHIIPRIAPHLLDRVAKEGYKGMRVKSTLDLFLQERVNKIVENYHSVLSQNEIHNIAVIIIDVQQGTVLAYTGNSNCPNEGSGKDVDIIMAPRSTGSILKPFLYTFMLQDGAILPNMLISDIPTQIAGYSPKNFEETYDGVVPASEALARSLNIPAVKMLQEYGLEKFYHHLKKLNLRTINQPANHYGLSIILGGAETTLWDLSNEYMKMVQTLNDSKLISEAKYVQQEISENNNHITISRIFEPGALWWTFEALSKLNRPWQEAGWEEFQSSQKIAWKTGTSFGHRDAWAIGMTPKYLVGIWVGNADGEGRPGLTGVGVAAPILFKIFKHLPYHKWFQKPEWDLMSTKVCKQSGYLASEICSLTLQMHVPSKTLGTPVCPYHEIVHLDKTRQYRVNSDCYPVHEMETMSWFLLPPVEELFNKKKNPFYKILPAYKNGCQQEMIRNMAVIYPKEFTKVFVPRELDGTTGKAVFEVAHRTPETIIYWHLDNVYKGFTQGNHHKEINPISGSHTMTLVDEKGETISWNFEILEK